MPPPLVSVIIPTWNRAGLLLRALRSVIGQTHRPLEVIVVDDGSNDGTTDLVSAFAAASEGPAFGIRYLPRPHRGVSAARNTGLAAAAGSYVQFLDSDDELLPDKITDHLQALQQTGADYSVGRSQFVSAAGAVVGQTPGLPVPVARRSYFAEPLWHVNSVLYRTAALRTLPGFDEDLIAGEDQLHACRLKLSGLRPCDVPRVSDRVHAHHGAAATDPQTPAALRAYSLAFGLALDRMHEAIAAADHLSVAESRRLWRFALGNLARASRCGDPVLEAAVLAQLVRFAPRDRRPLTMVIGGLTKLFAGRALAWRLHLLQSRVRALLSAGC